jgi:hypothetical protein
MIFRDTVNFFAATKQEDAIRTTVRTWSSTPTMTVVGRCYQSNSEKDVLDGSSRDIRTLTFFYPITTEISGEYEAEYGGFRWQVVRDGIDPSGNRLWNVLRMQRKIGA